MIAVGLFIGFVVGLVSFLLWSVRRVKRMDLKNTHVFVTGGSSGIGLEVAKEVVRRGAKVTIVARNENNLEMAMDDILKVADGKPVVQRMSVDVTESRSVAAAVERAEQTFGPVLMLVNCAGFSISRGFEDLKNEDFKTMMDINFLGSVYATKAVIPTMKKHNMGRVVFLSSQAGQLGLFGFTAYSASKFALTGMAQALQMEVKPYNIWVTVSYPPDTDTPGYKKELIGKPKETVLISETAGLYQPEYVAKTIVKDSLNGKFQSSIGMDGFLLSNIACGMSPVSGVLEAFLQIATMSIFRLVSLFYLRLFDKIVAECKNEKDNTNKSS